MADRPLRILVIGNLPPHVLGGAENQVARLVEAWRAAGAEVDVAGHRIPDGEQSLGRQTVRTRRIAAEGSLRFVRAARYFLALAKLVRRERTRYDVVYCRGLGDGALTLVLLKALGFCRWPLLVCPINARGRGDVAFLRSVPGARWLVRLVDRQVDAFNLINRLVEDDLRDAGIVRPPLHRIPNGIPVQPVLRRMPPGMPLRLVWTGRLDGQKGLDLLFEALHGLREHPWQLDLHGDGPDAGVLRRQVESLGLADQVRFHAPVPASQVRGLLTDADVFVLPSRYEGMSNAALEAMEAGLPVACTQCGGIDVAVADGAGWVCAPGSAKALQEMLARVFTASAADVLERGARARSLVEKEFEIGVVAGRNLDLLSALARGAR